MFRDDDSALDQVATGQVFTANQALEAGLIDRIGFIEEAVGRAVELAALSPDDVRVVEYHSKATSVADLLMGSQAQSGGFRGLSLQQMLDLTAPRAYYLSTWLPAVLSNTRP
jgi:protease-4